MEPDGLGDDRYILHSKVLQATLSEISSRPTTASPTSDGDNKRWDDTADAADRCCVICLDVVSEPCQAWPCAHRNFDFLCLVSWLNQRPSCPLCNADVVHVRYRFGIAGGEPTSSTSPLSSPQSYSTYDVPHPEEKAQQPASRPGTVQLAPRRSSAPRRNLRRRPEPPAALETDEDRALARRRRVYERRLYSLHVGTNRITRYTDLTPHMFDSDPTLASRARMWIRRELRVFDFLCSPADGRASGGSSSSSGSNTSRSARQLSNNAEFLLEYIVAILRTIDIKGSRGQAEEMLQEFLGREDARLFLHELRAWLRSPYTTLEAWDAHVQYDEAKITPAARIPRPSVYDSPDAEDEGARRRPSPYPDRYWGRSHLPQERSRPTARPHTRASWSPYARGRAYRAEPEGRSE